VSFIDRSLPPGDRDDAPLPLCLPSQGERTPTHHDAGREPAPDLLPSSELAIDAIGNALDSAQLALADVRLAAAQGNWPLFEAAARKLANSLSPDPRALARHLASTVHAARPRETRSEYQPTE
jgi:hypothetical protein